MLLLGILGIALAAQSGPGVLGFGMGSVSCATAWEPVNERASAEWVLGFWSGRNWERGGQIGLSTDRAGILAEVKLACANAPSMNLTQATFKLYDRMSKDRR
ncbi:hypothetical protein ABIC16_000263 [Sphingomonas sp. PvP055]|uniref:hypothetical protein n=1 Tax=Sphingomonas sp. PvP055 TaxID=3156391 RepID=UPI0033986BA7